MRFENIDVGFVYFIETNSKDILISLNRFTSSVEYLLRLRIFKWKIDISVWLLLNWFIDSVV